MKRLLLITNNYEADSANQRARKMADRVGLLLNSDWETVVLLADLNKNKIVHSNAIDLIGINSKRAMPHLSEKLLSKLMTISEVAFWDVWRIYQVGLKLIKKWQVDVIVTMCRPYHLHLAGYLLKKKCGLPWLAEFRDAWTTNPNAFPDGAGKFHYFLESLVVKKSDAIVWNYGVQIPPHHFQDKHGVEKEKLYCLNSPGFDGIYVNKYKNTEPKIFNKFTIIHSGNFYRKLNPDDFLKGFELALSKGWLNRSDIQVIFLGKKNAALNKTIHDLHIEDVVFQKGEKSYEECLCFLKGADIALLIIRREKGDELNIPSKVTDYILSDRPILTLAKNGWEAAKYIERNELGWVVDPDNPEDIAKVLKEAYANRKREVNTEHIKKEIDSVEITKKYADILSSISN